MRYRIPTCPNISNDESLASTLSPYGPITTPATIIPMICGIFSLFSKSGANRMIDRTMKNIGTGLVTKGIGAAIVRRGDFSPSVQAVVIYYL